MLETVETRWFFPGKLPKEVRRWHARLSPRLIEEPERTDVYLRTGDLTTLGTKLRQGSVQFKARIGKARKVKFNRKATGTLATWRKWNFVADDSDASVEPLFDNKAHWIRVRKKRSQHYFCWKQDTGLIEARAEADATCGVELVTAKVQGATYWSLALEAAAPRKGAAGAISGGPTKYARHCVKVVMTQIFAESDAPKCRLKKSLSYPEWLAGVMS